MDELHEPDKKKRAVKLKTFFIDGEQATVHHLYHACCNYLTLLHYMYDNAQESVQYKAIYNLFHYYHDTKGKKFLDQRLRQNDWFIHAMILELERTRLTFFDNLLISSELMSAAAAEDMELLNKHLEEAARAARDIYHVIVNAHSGSAGTFRFEPISWDYNNITKASTQSN